MACCSNARKWASVATLVAINCVLVLGGALVLWVGIYMHNSGWAEAMEGYWTPMDNVVVALIVTGCVILALAVLGCIAAICRWRLGLCLYAVVVMLILILFIVVTVLAFVLRGTASDWDDKTYPASDSEEGVKDDFDKLYCYAQGEYVCNEASVADAIAMFLPNLDSAILSLFDDYDGGVNALCNDFLDDYNVFSTICDGCDIAEQFEDVSSVVDWANDKCPPTSANMIWCGVFLATNSTDSSVGSAPYSNCRSEFLDLVAHYSLYLGIGGILVCIGALMAIAASFYLRHVARREQEQRHEGVSELDEATMSPSSDHGSYTKA